MLIQTVPIVPADRICVCVCALSWCVAGGGGLCAAPLASHQPGSDLWTLIGWVAADNTASSNLPRHHYYLSSRLRGCWVYLQWWCMGVVCLLCVLCNLCSLLDMMCLTVPVCVWQFLVLCTAVVFDCVCLSWCWVHVLFTCFGVGTVCICNGSVFTNNNTGTVPTVYVMSGVTCTGVVGCYA